ncbi:MAG: SLBB domain-containing protein [Candidatus Kapabacteria bacterium]|nr:SLBB domain-containing protein [Candidatus Kapabacteria bacterium]
MIKKIVLAIFVLSAYFSFAQIKGLQTFDPEKLFQEDVIGKLDKDQEVLKDFSTIGNIVDPKYYFVGPGDLLALQNLPFSVTTEYLRVTPEVSILIPRIGEISLKGKTLEEARELVINTIKKRNPEAIVSLSLYKPRNVLVSVKGNVIKDGVYSFPASYRVSTAIQMANLTQTQNIFQQQQFFTFSRFKDLNKEIERLYNETGHPHTRVYSLRNVTVIHSDGSSETADIIKAIALNNPDYDKYIKENDEIIVPYELEEFPTITVAGAVRKPGTYVYKQDDDLNFLLRASGGFTEDADLDNILLINGDGITQKINVSSDMKLTNNFPVYPGAILNVGRKNYELKQKVGLVSVIGNVKKPGNYQIIPGKTRLKEAIEMSGGFTNEAYLPLATIIRKENKYLSAFNPSRELFETFKQTDLTLEDTVRFNIDISYKKPYVACDFYNLYEKNDETQNVILEDGDLITIPSNPKSVYVFGQVKNPGYINYSEGKDIYWYIERAGGFAPRADKGRARIIRGKNKVWIEQEKNVKVFAGDEIYVPKPPDLPPGVELQNYSLIATAITTAISLSYLLITLFRK